MAGIEVKYTYQDLRSTPDDGKRYELFEGDLIVSPSPTPQHQIVISNLFSILDSFVRKQELGRVLTAPCDVFYGVDTVVEPDLLYISTERLPSMIKENYIEGSPDLVVEVTSPGTEERDRGFKFKLYADKGVKEYWLADYQNQILQIYQLTRTGFSLAGEFKNDDEANSPLFPDLRFRVRELWK